MQEVSSEIVYLQSYPYLLDKEEVRIDDLAPSFHIDPREICHGIANEIFSNRPLSVLESLMHALHPRVQAD